MPFYLAESIGRLPSFVLQSEISLHPPQSYVLRHDSLVILCGLVLLVHLCWTMSMNLRKDIKTKRYVFRFRCLSKLQTDAHMHSISLVNDLSLIPSLGLFISLCVFAGDAQIIIYGFWLFSQLVVGWGLVALRLQNPDKKMILLEMWSVFPVSFHRSCLRGPRVLKGACFLVINLLFAWRFFNVPQNWAPICDPPTWMVVILVLLSDILFANLAVISFVRWTLAGW